MKWHVILLILILAGVSSVQAQDKPSGNTLASTMEVYVFPKAGQAAGQQSIGVLFLEIGEVGRDGHADIAGSGIGNQIGRCQWIQPQQKDQPPAAALQSGAHRCALRRIVKPI